MDCGLGGLAADFDQLCVRAFPNGHQRPSELWRDNTVEKPSHARQQILEKTEGTCGALPLASVSISSSFVGSVAGTLVIAEVLRRLHGGKQCYDGDYNLRAPRFRFRVEDTLYDPIDMAKYGLLGCKPVD